MASLFHEAPAKKTPPPGPYSRDRIENEIAHLRKRGSVRHADQKKHGYRAAWPGLLLLGGLVWLLVMDPILHSWKKGEAIRAYLYLHHYGSDQKAHELAATGIFSAPELDLLNARQGSFASYYPDPLSADRSEAAIVAYLKGVAFLHAGTYDQLDALGKVRYQLFVQWGLHPPRQWSLLDPSIVD